MKGECVMMETAKKELLDFIRTADNVAVRFVERARNFQGEIYLFGAGNHLPFVVEFMRKYGVPIKGIIDSNRPSGFYRNPGKGSDDGDIPIINFEEFLSEKDVERDCWIVMAAPSAEESIRETVARYLPKAEIFSFETELYMLFFPLQNIEPYRAYLLEHWNELLNLYDAFADDLSRDTLISVLKGRLTGDMRWFQQCCMPDQYYPDGIIQFSQGEIIVDLGAYDGDTLAEFIRRCPDYGAAYCFEPNSEVLPMLEQYREQQKSLGRHIYVIPKGAWDQSTVLYFSLKGITMTQSYISSGPQKEYSFKIETAAVDEEVKEPISYMKMDIEGSEFRALHGAERQICENHPKLAVCVYHKNEDILDIWNYLRKLVPEYRFYLRHHLITGVETVLYAVPEEKGET